jgi:hypothetical protein
MAWRPHANLIAGELDNTVPGKVTGWLRFAGLEEEVKLDLRGDFHRDIRGTRIRLRKDAGRAAKARLDPHMHLFSPVQTGEAGDITAGRPPADYVAYPYIEWYSEENGRVVLELDPEQIEVIGQPLPAGGQEPVSRRQQAENMACFLSGLSVGPAGEDPGPSHAGTHRRTRSPAS